MVKKIIVLVFLSLFIFVSYADNFFYDVGKDYWANEVITRLVNDGYVKGYPDGTFKPQSRMSRAEFVTLLSRVLKLEQQGDFIFADSKNHWSAADIKKCISAGIIDKNDYKSFLPDGAISRLEVCSMLTNSNKNAKDIVNGSVFLRPKYSDKELSVKKISNMVYLLDKAQILKGYSDNTVKLGNPSTRAEICAFILRFINNKYKLEEYSLKDENYIDFVKNVGINELPAYMARLKDYNNKGDLEVFVVINNVMIVKNDKSYKGKYSDIFNTIRNTDTKYYEYLNSQVDNKYIICVDYTVDNTTDYSVLEGGKYLKIEKCDGKDIGYYGFDNLTYKEDSPLNIYADKKSRKNIVAFYAVKEAPKSYLEFKRDYGEYIDIPNKRVLMNKDNYQALSITIN